MSEVKKIRVFVAIELPSHIQEALGQLQSALKNAKAMIKWVDPENIHLTLKFIGYVENEKIELIKERINEVVRDFNPYMVTLLEEIRAFPNTNNIRVLWVGLDDKNETTHKINKNIESKLGELGVKKEDKKFIPHLTLARVKSITSRDSLKKLIDKTRLSAPLNLLVSKIALFESILTSKGPIYNKIYEVNLDKS